MNDKFPSKQLLEVTDDDIAVTFVFPRVFRDFRFPEDITSDQTWKTDLV